MLKHKLCNAHSSINDKVFSPEVDAQHAYFSPVVSIDRARRI
jgi:hypothetical protein